MSKNKSTKSKTATPAVATTTATTAPAATPTATPKVTTRLFGRFKPSGCVGEIAKTLADGKWHNIEKELRPIAKKHKVASLESRLKRFEVHGMVRCTPKLEPEYNKDGSEVRLVFHS